MRIAQIKLSTDALSRLFLPKDSRVISVDSFDGHQGTVRFVIENPGLPHADADKPIPDCRTKIVNKEIQWA